MRLEIVTPKKTIQEEGVDLVTMEGVGGSFGVLPGHTPLLAELKIAPLSYIKQKKKEFIAVMGGVARVLKDQILIVTDDTETAMEINILAARKEKEDAEAYLSRKTEIKDMIKAESQLRKALVRIKVAEVNKKQ
jgi:F-type H+-transporting ATPase subunit epsilon